MATAPTPGTTKAKNDHKPILLTRGDEQRTFRIADVSGLHAHELMLQTKVYTPRQLLAMVLNAWIEETGEFDGIDLNIAAALWFLAGLVAGVEDETWETVAGSFTYGEQFKFGFKIDEDPEPEVVREVDGYTPLSDSGET